jgi:hypothetical protein
VVAVAVPEVVAASQVSKGFLDLVDQEAVAAFSLETPGVKLPAAVVARVAERMGLLGPAVVNQGSKDS